MRNSTFVLNHAAFNSLYNEKTDCSFYPWYCLLFCDISTASNNATFCSWECLCRTPVILPILTSPVSQLLASTFYFESDCSNYFCLSRRLTFLCASSRNYYVLTNYVTVSSVITNSNVELRRISPSLYFLTFCVVGTRGVQYVRHNDASPISRSEHCSQNTEQCRIIL